MADNFPLHISIETKADQILHSELGYLELKKAGNIKVSVKQYIEEKKALSKKIEQQNNSKRKKLQDQIAKIETDQKRGYDFISGNREGLISGKVAKATYDKNLEIYNSDSATRATEKRRLQTQIDGLKVDEKSSDFVTLKKKYEKVRWVWQLVGSDRPKLDAKSYNEGIAAGQPELNVYFDDFLEGGGATYLEPYWEGQTPVGRFPHGILINAINTNSAVLGADWRDADDEVVTVPLEFGSTVYLNIYTQNLYGHNIKVQLKDKDKVIRILTLGLTNADDKLFAAEYLNKGVKPEERNEEDVVRKEDQFIRAVSVHTTKKFPGNAKHGQLLEEGQSKTDNNVNLVPNVQKCKFAVYIDPIWKHFAGEELSIYPEIEHQRIPNRIKKLSESTLEVKSGGFELKVEKIDSNQVAVISKVETDMAFFNPCKYTLLKGMYKNELPVFFDVNDPEKRFVSSLKYKVVAGAKEEENRTLLLEIPTLATDDCLLEKDKVKNHISHAVTINPKVLYPDLQIGYNFVSFTASYPRPEVAKGESMIDSDLVVPIHYPVSFSSCAISHQVDVEVYPAVEYELGFKLGTENPFYTKSTKSYVKRKYLGKWGFFDKRTNKKIRKEQRSQRKQDYKNEQQKVSANRLNYNTFDYFLEYGYDGVKQSNITIQGEYPVFDVIESVMWVINTVNLLTFEKEADEALEEHKRKRPNVVETRKDKRGKYLGRRNLSKFPFKIEVVPPTFAGTVKWNYEASKKEAGEIGKLYTLNFKADPLIEIKGCLDLLFVATKIPYLGQAISAITAVADTVGSADDFWNKLVEIFGGSDEHKIKIDEDYYLDLFVSGDFKIEAETLKYHTIDRFSWGGEITCSSEIKFGIECGGSINAKLGNVYSLEAEFKGEAIAVWEIKNENNSLVCNYQGLYAVIETRLNSPSNNNLDTRNTGERSNKPKEFLLHDGFSYEFKLD